MNDKHKLLLLLLLTKSISFSNLGRHDIDWINNYEDFAMNRGKYSIGQKNVIVYKKDGTKSGTIEQPIPNFDGVVDRGNFALWGDSQILSGVRHIKSPENFTFSKRHIRDDVELYEGYINSSEEDKYNKFSEKVKGYYRLNIGSDYSLTRTDKVAFDAYVPEGITKEDWERIKPEDVIARVGAGYNRMAIGTNKEANAAPHRQLSGGLNKIVAKWQEGKNNINKIIYLTIEKKAKTPLDSGTKPGDSGSPLFLWDKENKKWLIASSNSAGTGLGYGKSSYLLSNPEIYKKWKESLTDKEITNESDVKFENGTLKVGSESREFKDTNKSQKEINGYVNSLSDKIDEKVSKYKNQIFNKKDLSVEVTGKTNTGPARLEFKQDTTLKGSGTLETAGFVVHKGATLKYELKIDKGNTVRKIGEGKLVIKSTSNNEGDLNLGGGETVLENTNGYAAANIRLAQGAKLTITGENQIKDNNVIFGHRGGTLNLNGNNLEFKDIYHMDKDAKIVNENGNKNGSKDGKKSTFTFKPGNGKRVFLGSFRGNLDLNYKPTNEESEWSLRGEYTDITGKFDIDKGIVKIEGDNVVHGYKNVIYKDEYKEAKFKSESINIKNSSILSINRAVKMESNINVKDNSILELNLLGTVRNIPMPYTNAKTQKEINQTLIKGNINFNSSATTNFKANVENNNEAVVEAKLTGEIKAIKNGKGLLYLKNEDNSELKGNIEVNEGRLKVVKEKTLGNSKTLLKDSSVLEVENNNSDISDLLDKIDKGSKGVLSLGKSISSIDKKYSDYSNLYLGSSKDITIGDKNTVIDSSIKTLNLGGDSGTITLKGLDNSNSLSKVNIGNGISKSNVIIDSSNSKKIESNINISKNSTVDFSDGTDLKSVENSGTINLFDKNLKINKYTSNKGKFDIQLNEMNKKLLEIEDTDKNVDVSVKVKKDLIDRLIYKNEKLNIAKVKKHDVNILNIRQYDGVYEFNTEKDENNIVKLYATVKSEILNKLYVFNEIDLINNIGSELKYRNVIEANYVNYNKIDKNSSKMNHTEYKNRTFTNGVEINFEKANNLGEFKISGGFNFNVMANNLTTEIKNKETVKSSFASMAIIPRVGVKYGLFDINLGLGLNTVFMNNAEKDILAYINNSLSLGINPKFKVSNDVNIKYLNRIGYRVNALLNETISKNAVENHTILHKKPINVYYETGIKLEHKYVDFFTKANFEYNWSNYEIYNKGQKINNSFKDDWRINIKTGFEFKPIEQMFINLNFNANVYQKSYGQYIFKLGTGYSWG
ncbi:S6 family peptidase [Streptobacillus ratti]|uniref:S6 family peptidase n=1 Tax=Streptobacillus ratti TaxID=1720557 RepID=UPI000934135E|nr:S6 family peptidase [Streptobacillus ratti]